MSRTRVASIRNPDGARGRAWNPLTGCSRVSPGCERCVALAMAQRLKVIGSPRYQLDGAPPASGPGAALTPHFDLTREPLRWRTPSMVNLGSMTDLFHDLAPIEIIADILATVVATPRHTYQVLTKRHERMRALLGHRGFARDVQASWRRLLGAEPHMSFGDWTWPPPNLWLGVSAEDQHWADTRVPALLATPAGLRALAAEPLLGPLDLRPYLRGEPRLDWVVVGGETSRGARPMAPEWAISVVEQCRAANVPVFVKQLGSGWGSRGGADRATWPDSLRVRQTPEGA